MKYDIHRISTRMMEGSKMVVKNHQLDQPSKKLLNSVTKPYTNTHTTFNYHHNISMPSINHHTIPSSTHHIVHSYKISTVQSKIQLDNTLQRIMKGKFENMARSYNPTLQRSVESKKKTFKTIIAEREEEPETEVDEDPQPHFQLGHVKDAAAYEQESVAIYLRKEKGHQRKRIEAKKEEKKLKDQDTIRDIEFIKDVTSKFKDKIEKQRYLPFELSKDNYELIKQAKILPKEMEDRIQVKYDDETGMPNFVDITDEEYWKATYRVMYDLDEMLQQEERIKSLDNNPALGSTTDYFKSKNIDDPTVTNYHNLMWEQAHYAGKPFLVVNTFNDMLSKMKIRIQSPGMINAILYAYAKTGHIAKCKEWLNILINEHQIVPTVITWSIMVFAYSKSNDVDAAMQLLEMLREYDIPTTIVMHTNILNAMFKLGEYKRAEDHFHFMQSRYGIKPDIICFNVMLKVYEQTGQVEKAFSTYSQLEMREIFPTTETFAHLIGACVRRRSHREFVFPLVEQMEKLGFKPSKQILNSMIDAAARSGDPDMASRLLLKMKREYNMSPSGTTYTHLFLALASNQNLGTKYQNRNIAKANELYIHVVNNEEHVVVNKRMLDAYMRVFTGANRVTKALEFFNMKYAEHGMKPGRYSFGNLIEMYCRMGQVERAIQLKEKMIIEHGLHPSRHTYLQIINALFKTGDHDRVHDWMLLMKREGGYLLSPIEIRRIQINLKKTTNAYKELLVQRTNAGYNELE